MSTDTGMEKFTAALDRMVGAYREVELPKIDGKVCVRPLPFTTFAHVLMRLFELTRGDAREIRDVLVDGLARLSAEGKATTDDMRALFEMMTPVISRVVAATPEMAERIVLDVVMGSTEEHVRYMPLETVVAVIAEAVESVDQRLAVREIKRIFTRARGVWAEASASQSPTEKSAS